MTRYLRNLIFVTACVLVWSSAAHANDRATLIYRYEPEADLEHDGPPGKVSTHRLEVELGYPVIQDEEKMVIPGISLSWDHLEFKDYLFQDLDLYGVSLPVTMIYRGFDRTTIIGNLSPGLFSDFDSITDNDFSLFGMLIGVRELSDAFSISLGVIYNQDFGEPRVFPAVGFTWAVSETLELDMNMPRPKVVYTPNENLKVNLHAEPAGDKWSIHEGGEDLELVLENIRLGVGLEHRLAESIWLALDVGVNLDRSYEVSTEAGSTILDSGADDTAYFRLGIIYR